MVSCDLCAGEHTEWLKPERRNHRWARFTHGVLRRTVSGNKGGGKRNCQKGDLREVEAKNKREET